jgi:hypothetical protein
MLTIITILSIIYFALSVYAGMAIGEFCRRRFYWDDIGISLIMMCFFWFIPITVAMDLGWIQ